MSNDGRACPEQYGVPEGAKMIQDLIEHRNMNFAIGNIFKACYRLGHCSHSDKMRDLNKIIYFAERERDRCSRIMAGARDNIARNCGLVDVEG
jgi:hypothetical protein